jgi:hypothetical protein
MRNYFIAEIMDYIDRVYVELKDREPGNFLMSSLKDPEKFIIAVKFLIDGGWLVNVHWDSGYTTLFIEEKFQFEDFKKPVSRRHKSGWYDHTR